MEASQEASMVHDYDSPGPPVRDNDTPGPLDELIGGSETQVRASNEESPEHEAQVQKDDDVDEGEMEGVIQESQHEGAADDSEEEEGPITRGGRNLRVSTITTRRASSSNSRSPEAGLPNENVAPMKAATSSLLQKTIKRKRCPNQIIQKHSVPRQRTVVRDQGDGRLAFEQRPDSRNEVGVIPILMNAIPC
jgi:hypothetical protein